MRLSIRFGCTFQKQSLIPSDLTYKIDGSQQVSLEDTYLGNVESLEGGMSGAKSESDVRSSNSFQ